MQALPVLFEPPNLLELTSAVPLSHLTISALQARKATASGREGRAVSPEALSNVWVIYLVSQERTVCLEPRPSGSGARVLRLVCSFRDPSPSEVFRYDQPLQGGVTLTDVIDAIRKPLWLEYYYHPSGHGTRFWIWCIVAFLKEVGYVHGDINGLRIRLQQVWLPGGLLAAEEQQTHMVPGSFINRGPGFEYHTPG